MKRQLVMCLVTMGMLAFVSACERADDGSQDLTLTAPGEGYDKLASLQLHLEETWYAGESYAYDTVAGTIDIVTGGSFAARPASYPEGFTVAVSVPPGAVPAEYATDGEITISVQVPRFGTSFDSADAPCPIILEPHGVQFKEPITIWLVLPDALAERCDEGYLFYYLERKTIGNSETFDYRDVTRVYSLGGEKDSVAPPGFKESDAAGDCGNMIRCQVMHFSRWELEDGDCDNPGCS
jgi:hypothetical protein